MTKRTTRILIAATCITVLALTLLAVNSQVYPSAGLIGLKTQDIELSEVDAARYINGELSESSLRVKILECIEVPNRVQFNDKDITIRCLIDLNQLYVTCEYTAFKNSPMQLFFDADSCNSAVKSGFLELVNSLAANKL